ncbi:MAG: hypothetical protein IPL53_08180 [Ignavibacteria bacterium]|nr:hypothetical protein [Ignavibacteria bacterium]
MVSLLLTGVALYCRLFTDGQSGLGAVYCYPDPSFGNTLTLYVTVAFVSFMLAVSERLRHYLFSVLVLPFSVGAVAAVAIFIIKDVFSEIAIQTRS